MIVIVVFGLLASFGFRKKLKEKGYEESRAWAFPTLAGSFIFCFGWVMLYLSRFWLKPDSGVAQIYSIVVPVMAILIHGLIVAKLWTRIKALPTVD